MHVLDPHPSHLVVVAETRRHFVVFVLRNLRPDVLNVVALVQFHYVSLPTGFLLVGCEWALPSREVNPTLRADCLLGTRE